MLLSSSCGGRGKGSAESVCSAVVNFKSGSGDHVSILALIPILELHFPLSHADLPCTD